MQLLIVAIIAMVLCMVQGFHLMPSSRVATRSTLEMKGKGGRVPIDQRGEFMKRQRMIAAKAQIDSQKRTDVPVFNIFVRPKVGGLWIPCGDLAGDQSATALVNGWMSGFMGDMYKGQLENGVAKAIFNQGDGFTNNLIENYKPFKKFTKDDLEFGYKITFPGLEEKVGELKIKKLERGMEKTWVDKAKDSLGGLFGGGSSEE
jgi:hypothetical protein